MLLSAYPYVAGDATPRKVAAAAEDAIKALMRSLSSAVAGL